MFRYREKAAVKTSIEELFINLDSDSGSEKYISKMIS